MLLALWSHLHLVVLPVRKVQGLDLADFGNVAVDPRTVQADEHPQGAGAPPGICREEGGENTLENRDTWMRRGGYEGSQRQIERWRG